MHIHYIEHVAFEGLGSIEGWVRQENHILTATRPYLNEAFPPMEAIDLLIVLGGPMNIYDENKYPWLGKEKRFLDQAIAKGRSVLGICLGGPASCQRPRRPGFCQRTQGNRLVSCANNGHGRNQQDICRLARTMLAESQRFPAVNAIMLALLERIHGTPPRPRPEPFSSK